MTTHTRCKSYPTLSIASNFQNPLLSCLVKKKAKKLEYGTTEAWLVTVWYTGEEHIQMAPGKRKTSLFFREIKYNYWSFSFTTRVYLIDSSHSAKERITLENLEREYFMSSLHVKRKGKS
ncbi:hypothetical protein Gasu2_48440 [Galdieria sulphuraria]|nr:hypothetical protein Gasu2_48440 [Galdieria sulphuraria]